MSKHADNEFPVIAVNDLAFSYRKGKPALQNLSFSVRPGEVVGLVGANGSGKSTLCKVLQGVNVVPKGSVVSLCGQAAGTREAAEQVIFTGGNETVPQFLTGVEYIRYLYKLANSNKPLTKEAIEEKFSALGMGNRERDLISDYSHGMMKKVQLIAGLLVKPRVIIIDETLNGIDLESERKIVADLSRFAGSGGVVLICSHNLHLLQSCVTRILVLENGELKSDMEQLGDESWDAVKAILSDIGDEQ